MDPAKNDTKALWKSLNQIRGKSGSITSHILKDLVAENQILTESKQIADCMNKYFTDIASQLRCPEELKEKPLRLKLGLLDKTFRFDEITPGEVIKKVEQLKNSKFLWVT